MKDIAEAVGVSRNTLYRYYRDKTDLGLSIYELALDRYTTGLKTELDSLMH
tara:strand:+ start:2001 stop:2153 length:153 start_codon:yes stop_codon:yes gene_type:complete